MYVFMAEDLEPHLPVSPFEEICHWLPPLNSEVCPRLLERGGHIPAVRVHLHIIVCNVETLEIEV